MCIERLLILPALICRFDKWEVCAVSDTDCSAASYLEIDKPVAVCKFQKMSEMEPHIDRHLRNLPSQSYKFTWIVDTVET